MLVSVDGETASSGFAHIGDDFAPTEVAMTNMTGVTLCSLAVVPHDDNAIGWRGLIAPDKPLKPNERLDVELVGDAYVVEAADCAGVPIGNQIVSLTGLTTASLELSTGGEMGLSGTKDDPTESLFWYSLAVGDCVVGEVGSSRFDTALVPCSLPHDAQIIGFGGISEDVWQAAGGEPSDPSWASLDGFCRGDFFERFVGTSPYASNWSALVRVPSASGWEAGGRNFKCLLVDPTGSQLVGSKEGTSD